MKCKFCEPIDMSKYTHIQHEQFSNTYQFDTSSVELVDVKPYQCKDISVVIDGDECTISGVYGYDFNDHDHDIKLMMKDGQICVFTDFNSIPKHEIIEVIHFHPNYLHDKEFVYTFSDRTTIIHRVHNTMSMWGTKMLELLEVCKKNKEKR